jgi:hypothetical protein
MLVLLLALAATTTGAVSSSSNNVEAKVTSAQNKQQQQQQQQHQPLASVTSAFTRPPAHPALDFADVRLAAGSTAAAASTDRTQQQRRAAVAGTLYGELLHDDNDERTKTSASPEQVHLLPRGPGEMTVVWASAVAVEPGAVVRFGRVKHDDTAAEDTAADDALELTMEAVVSSTAYTAQICLGEPNNVVGLAVQVVEPTA